MGQELSRRDVGRGIRNGLFGLTLAKLASGPAGSALAAPATQAIAIDPSRYTAYIDAVPKFGQFYSYTCEFDAAWMVLATFGHETAAFEDLVAIVGHDRSIEPWYEETATGFVIYGGDITTAFSGDYTSNMLARASGTAIAPLFEAFDLVATPINTREALTAALDAGNLVWTKATVDFKPWADAIWITPDGVEVPTVLGNDHAVVINGYNQDVVVISDPLGPTSSNWERAYEYEVPWATFLPVWGAQREDGLAVGPAGTAAATIDTTLSAVEITGGA